MLWPNTRKLGWENMRAILSASAEFGLLSLLPLGFDHRVSFLYSRSFISPVFAQGKKFGLAFLRKKLKRLSGQERISSCNVFSQGS